MMQILNYYLNLMVGSLKALKPLLRTLNTIHHIWNFHKFAVVYFSVKSALDNQNDKRFATEKRVKTDPEMFNVPQREESQMFLVRKSTDRTEIWNSSN